MLGFGGRRAPESVAPVDLTMDEGSAVAVEDRTPEPSTARPEPAPAPEEPRRPPVDVVLTFEAASWLEVLVDDVLVEPGALVTAGETLRFSGQRTVALRFGNAGGVRVELNEVALGPPGRPGEVVRLLLGPDGPLVAPAAPGPTAAG